MNVYIVGTAIRYAALVDDSVRVERIEDADVVIFTGGDDVSPALYGCAPHPKTVCELPRDTEELRAFREIRPDQLALGICRGAQLLCVLCGGLLVQHCENHFIKEGTHEMTDGAARYPITSTHHQMMYPFRLPPSEWEMLCWAENRTGGAAEGEGIDPAVLAARGEPEIVVFHRRGLPPCLCVQGHPERMIGTPTAAFINRLIRRYLPK